MINPVAPELMMPASAENLRGSRQAHPAEIDEQIARVGSGTPCGEYVPMTINLFLRNMERHLAGKPLLNPVRPELG